MRDLSLLAHTTQRLLLGGFLIAIGAVGCGQLGDARVGNGDGNSNGNSNGDGGNPPTGSHILKGIQLSPADPILFLDNNLPASQGFTASAIYEDGTSEDITATAIFKAEKADLGSFAGPVFSSASTGGFTKVVATVGASSGYTTVTLVPRRLDASGQPLDFFFIAPYLGATNPTSAILTFSTNIKQADVGFIVDTTGSMNSKITALNSSLAALAATLKIKIPSVAMGVAEFHDWPCGLLGDGDYPFKLDSRIVTVATNGLAAIQSTIAALSAWGGGDGPESGFDALYTAATGKAMLHCDGSGTTLVPKFDTATAPGAVAGEMIGTVGGMGFRTGSLPVLVLATDAELHDVGDPADIPYAAYTAISHGHADTLAAINAIGGRFVGIASTAGGADFSPTFAGPSLNGNWEPYNQMVWLAQQTNSTVPPAAFANACGAGMCCTGVNGAAIAPAGGVCPMVYKVDSEGNGLGALVADAITKLVSFGGYDDGTNLVGSSGDQSTPPVPLPTGHTTADFLTPVGSARGVTPLDSMPAVGTVDGPVSIDTTKNAFLSVQPGTLLRFTVRVYNDFVEPTNEPQFFKATIEVVGNGAALLDSRDVFILVPPAGIPIL